MTITFTFRVSGQPPVSGLTLAEAHSRLRRYAGWYGLSLHLHPGTWAGNALSTAYPAGLDMWTDAEASVTRDSEPAETDPPTVYQDRAEP